MQNSSNKNEIDFSNCPAILAGWNSEEVQREFAAWQAEQAHHTTSKEKQSVPDIRQYIELSMQGDDTIDTRLEMFRHQREVLTQQIQQLQHTLETVEYKCWFYEAAKAAGTVDVPGAMTDADVPEQFRAIRQELRGQKMPNSER